jgi:hypothetical protein
MRIAGISDVILDLFDRKVIGRALSGGMETVHTTHCCPV